MELGFIGGSAGDVEHLDLATCGVRQ